jgi:NAD(P)-dependent dehydrogenase (short-subunit alcohol dehydrogenase family)
MASVRVPGHSPTESHIDSHRENDPSDWRWQRNWKHIAVGFAQAGARAVVTTGRTETSLRAAKEAIEAAATAPTFNAVTIQVDLMDEKGMEDALNRVSSTLGAVDVLVNCAG